MPPQTPSVPPPKNGFVDHAERMNSRAAMIGFFALLALEGLTGKGLLEMLGFSVRASTTRLCCGNMCPCCPRQGTGCQQLRSSWVLEPSFVARAVPGLP